MSEELKPCPFCGGKPEVIKIGNNATKSRKFVIRCPKCRVELTNGAIRNSFEWLEDISTFEWNSRSVEDTLLANLADLQGENLSLRSQLADALNEIRNLNTRPLESAAELRGERKGYVKALDDVNSIYQLPREIVETLQKMKSDYLQEVEKPASTSKVTCNDCRFFPCELSGGDADHVTCEKGEWW